MNVEVGAEFGAYFNRIPLTTSASIRHGNALRLDWEAFVPPPGSRSSSATLLSLASTTNLLNKRKTWLH